MASRDMNNMQRRRLTGLVVTLGAAGALVAAGLLASTNQALAPPELAVPAPSASAARTLPNPPRQRDEEFARLTAPEAPLAATYLAYSWIKECLSERRFEAEKIKYWPSCGLSDVNVDDVQLRKQLLTRLVRAGSFCATMDLYLEGPGSSSTAFADDPKSHARLLEEGYDVGRAMGEPCAAIREAAQRQSKGDWWRWVGATERAREQYVLALAYGVASAAGLARQKGLPFARHDDRAVQEALRKYGSRLTPQDRDAAITAGERIAEGWLPLLTSKQMAEGEWGSQR